MKNLIPKVEKFIQFRINDFDEIDEFRKTLIKSLVDYIIKCIKKQNFVRLMFLCTYNSRRSHLSQVWATIAAYYYEIPNVETFSGGTEETSIYKSSMDVLKIAGMEINQSNGTNPIYEILYAKDVKAIKAYSKVYYIRENPTEKYGAIVNCSKADKSCPIITGADFRFTMLYKDPKEFDNTKFELEKYIETNNIIATELLYVFYLCKIELNKSI